MKRTWPYLDKQGRPWLASQLDALLCDSAVRLVVEHGARIGTGNEADRWSSGLVLAWAQKRYRRPEPAALLLLLVTRFFDLGGEPDISWRRANAP